MGATTESSLQALERALAHLADPEIPVVSLSELGILREVREGSDGVPEVVITPTYSGCPAMGQIEDDIVTVLREAGLPGRVVTQLSPAWTTDWMSDAAKEKLRAYGIAPPSPEGVRRGRKAGGFPPIRHEVPPPRRFAAATPCPAHGKTRPRVGRGPAGG